MPDEIVTEFCVLPRTCETWKTDNECLSVPLHIGVWLIREVKGHNSSQRWLIQKHTTDRAVSLQNKQISLMFLSCLDFLSLLKGLKFTHSWNKFLSPGFRKEICFSCDLTLSWIWDQLKFDCYYQIITGQSQLVNWMFATVSTDMLKYLIDDGGNYNSQSAISDWTVSSVWPHLALRSGSFKYLGMSEKYFPIFSHRSDWGTQPLWAWMTWYLASCLAMSLREKEKDHKTQWATSTLCSNQLWRKGIIQRFSETKPDQTFTFHFMTFWRFYPTLFLIKYHLTRYCSRQTIDSWRNYARSFR